MDVTEVMMMLISMGTTGLVFPQKWGKLDTFVRPILTVYILMILGTLNQVNCEETTNGVPQVSTKNKVMDPLDEACVQNIRSNLVKFIKRQSRQDDGDDGDDGDGEGAAGAGAGGIGGAFGQLFGGNNALQTLAGVPAALPQLIQAFTQFTGAVNLGLNGTDTPNIPAFLVKHGIGAATIFQAIAQGHQMMQQVGSGGTRGPAGPPRNTNQLSASQLAQLAELTNQGIAPPAVGPPQQGPWGAVGGVGQVPPGFNPASFFNQQPPVVSSPIQQHPYPGATPGPLTSLGSPASLGQPAPIQPEDYQDEDVRQPVQPTLAPLLIPGQHGVSAAFSGYDPIPPKAPPSPQGDITPLVQNEVSQNTHNNNKDADESKNGSETEAQNTASLWQIYQMIQKNQPVPPPREVNREDIQSPPAALAPPAGFDFSKQAAVAPAAAAAAYPDQFSNSLLQSMNLAISTIRGQMIDLNSDGSPRDTPEPPIIAPQKVASNPPPSPTQQTMWVYQMAHRPSAPSVYRPSINDVPFGGGGTGNYGAAQKPGGTVVSTGSLQNLKNQQTKQQQTTTPVPSGPHFVKSPVSSHMTLPIMGYVPSVVSVFESVESLQQIGPQQTNEDVSNGFGNKRPYTPLQNGVLIEAPRLKPSYIKKPSNLMIHTDEDTTTSKNFRDATTSFPQFAHQVKNRERVPSNTYLGLAPNSGNIRPPSLINAAQVQAPQNLNGVGSPSSPSFNYRPQFQPQSSKRPSLLHKPIYWNNMFYPDGVFKASTVRSGR